MEKKYAYEIEGSDEIQGLYDTPVAALSYAKELIEKPETVIIWEVRQARPDEAELFEDSDTVNTALPEWWLNAYVPESEVMRVQVG
jgi:hypothetical protein